VRLPLEFFNVFLVRRRGEFEHPAARQSPDVRALIEAIFRMRPIGGVEDLPRAGDHSSERGKDAPENDRLAVLGASEPKLEIGLPSSRRTTVADLIRLAGIRECLDSLLRTPDWLLLLSRCCRAEIVSEAL
jgi:hypothetical protein